MNTTIKVSTEEALKFVSDYYTKKGINNNPNDWELTKKYKNFMGVVCRDFINKKERIRAIVTVTTKNDKQELNVIENENYEYFLNMLINKPVFYYVPAISNYGLVFIFESAGYFDHNEELSPHSEQHRPLLKKVFNKLFNNDVFSLDVGLMFAFPNTEMDDVIRKLEKNKFQFNPKMIELLDQSKFHPVIPEISLIKYNFPKDETINQEDAINIIFSIISQKEQYSEEDYARIKYLLKKVKFDEFPIVKKIALSFHKNIDPKLSSIFEFEENKKKAQKIVKDIWLKKITN